MRRVGLKWHVKWDPLIIKVSFKCKFVCSEAYSISLILKFGLNELTTKAFPFCTTQHSFQHTSFNTSHPLIQYAWRHQQLLVLQWEYIFEIISDRVLFCAWCCCHPKTLEGSTESVVLLYPLYLPLWDASNASVEVQVLLSSEQIVQGIHLGTVADVNSLVTTLHDVYQPPGGKKTKDRFS